MAIYDRHEWLAGRVESAIDPDRPIIDPHHHLWDRDDSRYLAQELRTDARSSHNVTHTVFVECSAAYDPVICGPVADDTMAPVGETRFVAEQAAEALRLGGPEIAGIVGHVDLTMGERVAEVLAEHEARGAGSVSRRPPWHQLEPTPRREKRPSPTRAPSACQPRLPGRRGARSGTLVTPSMRGCISTRCRN